MHSVISSPAPDDEPGASIRRLYALLGADAVLLPLPKGEKGPRRKGWPKVKFEETQTPEYQAELLAGDVGVLQGRAGNGICSVDCDTDAAGRAFLEHNPRFGGTLRTRGARGCNFWFRIKGEIPKSGAIHRDGVQVGEWRADGSQTKILGMHPKGMAYLVLNETPPVEVEFSKIVWPQGWTAGCIKSELDELCDRLGEPGFFGENENGSRRFTGLNLPHWAARAMMVHDCIFEPGEGQFFGYNPDRGLWAPISRAVFGNELATDIREWGRSNMIEAAVEKLLSHRLLSDILRLAEGEAEARDAFARPRTVIHVANGMIDLTTVPTALLPFNRSYFSRNQTPVPWLPDATCPRFLNELLGVALEPEDIGLLQRWLGSVLLGGNRAQRILLLTGTAGGGKGTLMEIVERIVGQENVAQLRTHLLAERFELGRVVGRSLLVGKDVDAGFLQERGAHVLKAIVGHDLQTGERKGSSETINFRGEFSVAIVANSRLRVRLQGDSEAWRRRLICIDYARPKPAKRIENFARLLLEAEGSGILRWAIEGAALHLRELEEHGDFFLTTSQLHRVDALLSESDSLRRFAQERIVTDRDADVTVSEIVVAYAEYCDQMDWAPQPASKVQRDLPNVMLDLFRATRRQDIIRNGSAQRGFSGVALQGLPGCAVQPVSIE
jgi:P4 family phage/plasmid primase-like protien